MSRSFDTLFEELTTLWVNHQNLRASSTSIAALAESRARLDSVRVEMRRSLAGLV